MTRKQFIKAVSDEACVTSEDVDVIMRAAEQVIVKALRIGERIKLFAGFVLSSVLITDYHYKDPQTGEYKVAEPFYRCRLTTSRTFKDRINEA